MCTLQLTLAEGSMIINVQHVNLPSPDAKNDSHSGGLGAHLAPQCFGYPFLLTILETDTLEVVKSKVQVCMRGNRQAGVTLDHLESRTAVSLSSTTW